jgi:hypothetical protein
MLKKYNDFLFESLILESVVVYSAKFTNLLKNMESPVAKALLDIESKDLSVTNNYIDIGADKEQISFIPDRKAQELISPENAQKWAIYRGDGGILKHSEANTGIFKLLDYTPEGDMYHPNNGEKGEVLAKAVGPVSGNTYLKIKFADGISVINQNKISYEDVSKMPFSRNRQSIRIGRGIRGLLTTGGFNFTDAEIEKFVNQYKAEWDKMNDIFRFFEIVKGEDIAEWYKYQNYEFKRDKGTLSSSCMCAAPSSFFEIYTQNPDVCQLLILKTEDDKIKGRALVWKANVYISGSKMEITFMDRVYTHEDADVELFRQYAKKMGWHYKSNNNHWNLESIVAPDGTSLSVGEITVQVNNGDYSKYPYLDTLKRYSPYTGILSNKNGDYELEDTGGGRSNSDECDYCGGEGRVDCSDCDGNGRFDCDDCDGRGRITCDDCDGDGEKECPECNGEGKIDGEECEDCSGKGKISCPECDGDGDKECSNCDGDGKVDCSTCDGDGRVDCPECR